MSEVIKHNSKLWERKNGSDSYFLFWCPGCGHAHSYQVPRWTFNGNHEKPSFTPSLRIFTPAYDYGNGPQPERTCCHLYVTDGELRYCGDCPHDHNGKTVPMQDIPADYGF